jgi:large subunit ribosomal protein L18
VRFNRFDADHQEAAAAPRTIKTRAKIRELGVARLTVHRTPRTSMRRCSTPGGKVLASASTVQDAVAKDLKGTGNVEAAKAVGRAIAERAKAAGITRSHSIAFRFSCITAASRRWPMPRAKPAGVLTWKDHMARTRQNQSGRRVHREARRGQSHGEGRQGRPPVRLHGAHRGRRRRGTVGFGFGKAREVPVAISKAMARRARTW